MEHHGSLSSPWERLPPGLAEGRRPKEGAWSVLPEQLKALDTGAFRALAASLGLPDPGPFLDYSALLDADRRLAGQALPLAPRPIPPRAVETHLAAKGPSGPLGPHREALFRGVARALEAPLERLFPAHLTLTAPTGAGKTLAALRFALGLRERVREESGLLPKVVYALPYIAIADQVEEEARGVLARAGLDPETHLLVHHHLALARLREEEAVEEALALQETWDRDVVVTSLPRPGGAGKRAQAPPRPGGGGHPHPGRGANPSRRALAPPPGAPPGASRKGDRGEHDRHPAP
ncbi:DEAD/DEAH box helicase, partial [Thermus sp.]|uniref:DEAD/DEAH box helicase n=1 Tax=Thermus sp. TaxID=275 RepID=UPI00321FD81E